MQESISATSPAEGLQTPPGVQVDIIEDFLSSQPDGDQPSQPDLFVVTDMANDWPVKDDMSSMEFPIFALTKRADTRVRTYSRAGKVVKIIPSVVGSATVFDKDLLIYAISQIVKASEQGAPVSRRIKIKVHSFLVGTRRSTGGASYTRVVDTCRRLKGTTIETNVKTTEEEKTNGFSLIDDYKVTQRTKGGEGALELELTISDWLYRAAVAYDILTLHPDYFLLSQALERRLYELARKHCGDKAYWKCSVEILKDKCGSTQKMKYFVDELRNLSKDNGMPDYRLAIDDSVKPYQVVFFSKDSKKVMAEVNRTGQMEWFGRLLQACLPRAARAAA